MILAAPTSSLNIFSRRDSSSQCPSVLGCIAHKKSRTQAVSRVNGLEEITADITLENSFRSPFNTGSMEVTTSGATVSLSSRPLETEKYIAIIRHGMTTWNEQKRIQGSSEESDLTVLGVEQAMRCRDAICRIPFDSCFTSPIGRAYKTAQIIWDGREGPLVPLAELKEANLGYLQGLKNSVAAKEHTEVYKCWRERPAEFYINGRYPVKEVFEEAIKAWRKILDAPGSAHLIVTHKSILRALLCTALGLPPSSFRSVDVNNGSISIFKVNCRGEPMLSSLNLTSHIHIQGVYY